MKLRTGVSNLQGAATIANFVYITLIYIYIYINYYWFRNGVGGVVNMLPDG